MKIKNLLSSTVVITAAFLTCAWAEDLSKSVLVSDAWVQAMPPSVPNGAAYMTIANNSFNDIVLVSVSSEIAGVTEIHKMSEMNGMMNMAPVSSQLRIPALSKLLLQPTSVHLMLINLKKPLHKGDIVPITLHFQGGGTVVVNAVVKMQYGD